MMRLYLLMLMPLLAAPGSTHQDPPKRLEAWPALTEKARTQKDILRLRKAKTEEMGIQASAALIKDGAAAAPLLIEAFAKERGEEARERVLEVLDQVVGRAHTRLLEPWFKSKYGHVRVWALRKAAAGVDPELVDAAREFWAGLSKRGRKLVDGERQAAALLLVSAGDTEGLTELFALARKDWKHEGPALRVIVAGVRGEAGEGWLLTQLTGGDRKAKSAALRLLSVAGSRTTLNRLGPYLESTDNTLRIDAINVCRGLVDGDPPLTKLAVFEAIELAQSWRARL
jgi:hypothetical protein